MCLGYVSFGALRPSHQYCEDAAGDDEEDGREEEPLDGVRPGVAEHDGLSGMDAVHSGEEQDGRGRKCDEKEQQALHLLGKPVEPGRALGYAVIVEARHGPQYTFPTRLL